MNLFSPTAKAQVKITNEAFTVSDGNVVVDLAPFTKQVQVDVSEHGRFCAFVIAADVVLDVDVERIIANTGGQITGTALQGITREELAKAIEDGGYSQAPSDAIYEHLQRRFS